MSTDLEARIRAALRERADEVTLQQSERRTGTGRERYPLLLVAASVIVVLAIAVPLVILRGSSTPPTAPSNGSGPGFVGYHWRITTIHDRYGTLHVPANLRPSIGFGTDGQVLADDSANALDGRYQVVDGGYTTSHVASTLVGGFGSPRSSPIRVSAAVDAVLFAAQPTPSLPRVFHHVRAGVDGDRLTLHAGNVTVTAVRDGVQPGEGDPSSTPSATSR